MIPNFLNKPLSDDLISRIAEQCTFSGMKKNAASYSILFQHKIKYVGISFIISEIMGLLLGVEDTLDVKQ